MPRTHPQYPDEFRQQILELARAGRSPDELAKEFEPTAQTIRNWIKPSELDHGQRDDCYTMRTTRFPPAKFPLLPSSERRRSWRNGRGIY